MSETGDKFQVREGLESSDLNEGQKEVLRPLVDRADLKSFKIEALPHSSLLSVRFDLLDGNEADVNDFNSPEVLKQFPMIITENADLGLAQLDHQYLLNSKRAPQILHHDKADLVGEADSVGLYQSKVVTGATPRRAPTWFGDAEVVWKSTIKWIKENSKEISSEVLEAKEFEFWQRVKEVLKDPQAFLRKYEVNFNSKSFLKEEISKWGMDPQDQDGLIIRLVDSELAQSDDLAFKLYHKIKPFIRSEQWRSKKLILWDNRKLVHGLGLLEPGLSLDEVVSREQPLLATHIDLLKGSK